MTMDRIPARDSYDAMVDMASTIDRGVYVYVLVKFTYLIAEGRCRLTEPESLFYDLRNENLTPRIKAGTDFWDIKESTDFVIQGSAHAPGGQPAEKMEVSVEIGRMFKRIAVFGRRFIQWRPGANPRIIPPEPFTEMPLTYENAYGGIDWRVFVDKRDSSPIQLQLQFDHPGMYPRNPFGKGYIVEPEEVTGMEMPNLEDPEDLLAPERLIVKDPKMWFNQPLPWCLDWVHPFTFPRYIFFASPVDAWFPAPDDIRLPEVKRGFVMPGFRAAMSKRTLERGPDPLFYQEASHGMAFHDMPANQPVVIRGMHPRQEAWEFSLPGKGDTPRMDIEIEGHRERVQPHLHHVVCSPGEDKLTMVFGATLNLPRMFIPGIHKHIPISAYINEDVPIHYEAPPTIKELIDAAIKPKAKE